jgi:hypothetical protein
MITIDFKLTEYDIEKFKPGYLLTNNTRPKITYFPPTVTYNSTISLILDPTVPISRITFVRYSTVTHSTNTDQRFIEPIILYNNGSLVIVRVPPNGNIAPPGNWFIFALTDTGIPSYGVTVLFQNGDASFVEIPAPPPTPTADATSSATVAGKTSGAVGVFASRSGMVMGLLFWSGWWLSSIAIF